LLDKHPGFLPQYEIEGSLNLDQHPVFQNPDACPNFQEGLEGFKKWLIEATSAGNSCTIYKFGDGDYYFLKKIPYGSATPGKRSIGKDYSQMLNHDDFINGVVQNDLIAVELYNTHLFRDLYPGRPINIPAEFGYGLVSSRWLTKNFSGKIGIIGADKKIDLIQGLMENVEYQEFLGLETFNDYIKIPQKFACDDLESLERSVATQLENSSEETRIFLVGIGHVKSGLLHRLKKYKNAIFYDVGSGIDALAGIVDFERPYMGSWTNFRLKSFDYSQIDFLQYVPVVSKERWI
jgi:hypothetical protein